MGGVWFWGVESGPAVLRSFCSRADVCAAAIGNLETHCIIAALQHTAALQHAAFARLGDARPLLCCLPACGPAPQFISRQLNRAAALIYPLV